MFDCVGGVLTVAESQLDAVTAVSGSGPAYFFLMVEALVDAGVAQGLSRPVATDLVVQTMAGSAAMLLEGLDKARRPAGDGAVAAGVDTTAAQLRATVTSPAGTTAAGLRELERGGLRAAVADAVAAAKPALSSWESQRSSSGRFHQFSTEYPTPVAATPSAPLFSRVYARVRSSGGEATGTGRA